MVTTAQKTGYEDNANALEYVYDNNGNLGLQKDNIAGRTTKYYYDMQDRLMRYDVSGSGYSSSIQWGYDDLNNLTTQTHTLNGTTYTESYSYDKDNRLKSITNGDVSSTYSYDLYSRMNTLAAMNNQINSISPKYWDAFKELALGVLDYGWNQMTNEILYWTGN